MTIYYYCNGFMVGYNCEVKLYDLTCYGNLLDLRMYIAT